MDKFYKKAKCFRLKIDDSLNTYKDKYYECLGVDKYENIR